MSRINRLWLAPVVALLLLPQAQARMSPREIYKTQADAVVLIVAAPEGSSSASAGTGSLVDSKGTVVTNCHVIFDESKKKPFPAIHVFLKPSRVTGDMNKDLSRHYTASVISYDHELDLALLKMENPPAGLKTVTLGDPEEIGPGDETIAIGHPEQGGLWTITTGVIGTEFENFKGVPGKNVFQMETSLNRGNSGGPLFDVRGYQVGVNTAIARQGEGGVAITGVNFALKASVVKNFAAKNKVLLAYGSESLDSASAQVAVAEAPKAPATRQPADRQPDSAPAAVEEKPVESGGGYIKVEEDQPEEQPQERPAYSSGTGDSTEVKRPATATAGRKPHRFATRYRTRPRPYTFGKLFTAVDKVRENASKAFDDLDNEIERMKRRRGQ